MRRGRARRLAAAATAIVVAVVAAVVVVRQLATVTHDFDSPETGPVTVTAPREAGAPRFDALPAADPTTVPPGLLLAHSPVPTRSSTSTSTPAACRGCCACPPG